MSNEWSKEDFENAVKVVSEKAKVDGVFREKCLANPSAAVFEATGKEIPESFRLNFVSNNNADMTFVLPDLVLADGELSDADLEKVAGGGKREAQDFFGSISNTMFGTNVEVSSTSGYGIAGSVIGTIGAAGLAIAGHKH